MCKPVITIDPKFIAGPTTCDSFNTPKELYDKVRNTNAISGTVNGIRFAYSPYFDDGFIASKDRFERDYVRLAVHHYVSGQLELNKALAI